MLNLLYFSTFDCMLLPLKVILATKHHKEKAIAPAFDMLGVQVDVAEGLNTDLLGTFDGEVERKQSPLDTARLKCQKAAEIYPDAEAFLASEGSFGPHPMMGLIIANEEWILYQDRKNSLEIWAKSVSTSTNYNQAEIKSEEELLEFAEQAQFPSHALICSDPEKKAFYKGIQSLEELKNTFHKIRKSHSFTLVQTDMRALYNPTRMEVIAETANLLVEKINRKCPECGTPGFEIKDVVSGLPCKACGHPTKSTLKHIYGCQKCGHEETILEPKGKKFEDPMNCSMCNP